MLALVDPWIPGVKQPHCFESPRGTASLATARPVRAKPSRPPSMSWQTAQIGSAGNCQTGRRRAARPARTFMSASGCLLRMGNLRPLSAATSRSNGMWHSWSCALASSAMPTRNTTCRRQSSVHNKASAGAMHCGLSHRQHTPQYRQQYAILHSRCLLRTAPFNCCWPPARNGYWT